MAGFAVNQVLFDELQAADETLKTSEISTPRDDTILKAMKNKMQTEIVRGLTVVSFVDTVEEANVSIMAASIAVYSCRALQSRRKVALMELCGKQTYGLDVNKLIRHGSILVRREIIEGLRVKENVSKTFDYRNILKRVPGTDHRKINYDFNLNDSNKPKKLPSIIETHAKALAISLRNNVQNVTNKQNHISSAYRIDALGLMKTYPEIFSRAISDDVLLQILNPLMKNVTDGGGGVSTAALDVATAFLSQGVGVSENFLTEKTDLAAFVTHCVGVLEKFRLKIKDGGEHRSICCACMDVLSTKTLAKHAASHIAVLAQFLRSSNKTTQLATSMCIKTICKKNPDESMKELLALLTDDDSGKDTIVAALYALRVLGARVSEHAKPVMALVEGMENDRKVRLEAMETVVAIQIEEVQYAGVKAPLIMFLRGLLRDELPEIRSKALDIISQSLGPAAIRYDKNFGFALRDENPSVRRSALKSLKQLGKAAKRFSVQVAHALEDPFSDIRFQAKDTIVAIDPPPSSASLFTRRFAHKDGTVRLVALSAFVAIFGQRLKDHARTHAVDVVKLWHDPEPEIRRLALQFTYDHLCGETLFPYNDDMAIAITDSDMLAQTTAVQILKKSPNLDLAARYMHHIAQLIEDDDPPVRNVICESLRSCHRFAVQHDNNLQNKHKHGLEKYNQLKEGMHRIRHEAHEKIKGMRGNNLEWILEQRRSCRQEIIEMQSKNSKLSNQIAEQVAAYKELVDQIKMQRIERRYASQELERMLNEARAGIGDLTKEEVVRRTLESEEKERVQERERAIKMSDVRNKERDLINIRKNNEVRIEELQVQMDKNDKRYERKEAELTRREEESRAVHFNQVGMLEEETRTFDIVMRNEIHDYEKYRRILIAATSKSHSVPIRLSALQALKSVHLKWEGCKYTEEIEKCLAMTEVSQIRSAATDLLLYVTFPDQAYRYARQTVRDLPKLCSKSRQSATDGLMALGAVATQLGSHFIGSHGVYPEVGTFAIKRKYIGPLKIGLEQKITDVFKLLDTDGNGSLEKKEISRAISRSENVRNILRTHPALERFLKPKLWQKTFMAMDTSQDGVVELDELISFVKRTMAGVDPIVSGKTVELNKKWINLPKKI